MRKLAVFRKVWKGARMPNLRGSNPSAQIDVISQGRKADYAYVMESGRIVLSGHGKDLLDDEKVHRAYLG
jgi:hypothetical protein